MVRWHGVPLSWVLHDRKLEDVKNLGTRTDLRLLAIFSLMDFAGRISYDHKETLAKMRRFQEINVPQAEYEFGNYQNVQEKFLSWNLRHKNAAWSALQQKNLTLLEKLLEAEQIPAEPTYGKKVIMTVGPPLAGKTTYLEKHHADEFRVNLEEHGVTEELSQNKYLMGRKMVEFKHFLTIYLNRNRTVVLDGRLVNKDLRSQLNSMIRGLNVEVEYLVFETALDDLLLRNRAMDKPLSEDLLKTADIEMELLHPWEAHKIEYVK